MDPRAGQEPINALGVVLGVGLALLILVLFGYTFIRWYQRHRPDFVFNLYHTCGLGSVAVELVPPFSISGSLSGAGSGYVPFYNRGP
ncbi:small integral membrane protein 35 [Calonectris borealis]|uniref:small integral membrane protein 35 n=1 Tax=Calonectris borealis TaxID=1323832 RepID=UPI003F4C7D9C